MQDIWTLVKIATGVNRHADLSYIKPHSALTVTEGSTTKAITHQMKRSTTTDGTHKAEAYKEAFRFLKRTQGIHEFQILVATVAVSESIISDRFQSHILHFGIQPTRGKIETGKYVGTKDLILACRSAKGGNAKAKLTDLETTDLFAECEQWLQSRNDILHGFVKSNPAKSKQTVAQFKEHAIIAAEQGYKLARLVRKWAADEVAKLKKKG